MMIASKGGFVASLLAGFVSAMAATATAELISFSYTQTDTDTGAGTLQGTVNGINFLGEMPAATVTQNDSSNLTVPAGMVGYMDGAQVQDQDGNPRGNPFGVHIGWNGSVTLQGEVQIDTTTVELYELDVDLVIPSGGAPGGGWSYSADITDDDGGSNDAGGTGFRIAGWVGNPADGHRHSDDLTRDLNSGLVDSYSVEQDLAQIDAFGWDNGPNMDEGDNLGIGISFRDGVFTSGSGPVYVDRVTFTGSVFVDETANPEQLVGTALAADLNTDGVVDLADYDILAGNFFSVDTTRQQGDMNFDQVTDIHDFVLFRAAFNAPAAAVVPEPATLSLLMLGGLFLSLVFRLGSARRGN